MKAVLAIGMMLMAASVATPVDVEPPTPGGLLQVSVAVCCCAASLVLMF